MSFGVYPRLPPQTLGGLIYSLIFANYPLESLAGTSRGTLILRGLPQTVRRSGYTELAPRGEAAVISIGEAYSGPNPSMSVPGSIAASPSIQSAEVRRISTARTGVVRPLEKLTGNPPRAGTISK